MLCYIRGIIMKAAILNLEEAADLRKRLKKEKRRLVMTNGCFDLLHGGHIHLFHEASLLGDVLLVAVNTDETIARLKGPTRPIFPLEERLEVLSGLRDIDYLLPFAEETPLKIVSAVLPDVLAKGGDWTPDTVIGRREVEQAGGRVVIIPYLPGLSTTSLIERIRSAEIP